MAIIAINDLNPVGYSLFNDRESYLLDLSSDDNLSISGGISPGITITTSSEPCVSFVTLVTLLTYRWTTQL
jgi:hypothetical protein